MCVYVCVRERERERFEKSPNPDFKMSISQSVSTGNIPIHFIYMPVNYLHFILYAFLLFTQSNSRQFLFIVFNFTNGFERLSELNMIAKLLHIADEL